MDCVSQFQGHVALVIFYLIYESSLAASFRLVIREKCPPLTQVCSVSRQKNTMFVKHRTRGTEYMCLKRITKVDSVQRPNPVMNTRGIWDRTFAF